MKAGRKQPVVHPLDGTRKGRAPTRLEATCGQGLISFGKARRVGRERMSPPGLYCPSGERDLSQPSSHQPWQYSVLRAYKSPESRSNGKGGVDQPVQGPWHGHRGNAWGQSCTSWFMVPRLVKRPVHVPWPNFFFPTQHSIALRVASGYNTSNLHPIPAKMPDTLRLSTHGSNMALCDLTCATRTAHQASPVSPV